MRIVAKLKNGIQYFLESLRCLTLIVVIYKWSAGITGFYDLRIYRDSAQKRHVHFVSHNFTAAGFKDVRFLTTLRADKTTHILQYAENG